MVRISSFVFAAAAALAISACTPSKPATDGATAATPGTPTAAEMKAGAAAAAAALATGALNDPNMTPEERAKAQKVYSNIAAGNVDPSAAAYLTGMNKAMTVLGAVKDEATLQAAKGQLTPIFAEMKPAADKLNAMSKDDRDVAMGSSAVQIMQLSMTMMGNLTPIMMSNQKLGEEISKLMDQMPEIKD